MRAFRVVLLCIVSLILAGVDAKAQSYPTKPVKILVPYAPGGTTDIVARIIAEQMRQSLGQPFVVENRPGANGIIAVDELARSKPDGHSIMITPASSTIAAAPSPPESPRHAAHETRFLRVTERQAFPRH